MDGVPVFERNSSYFLSEEELLQDFAECYRLKS